MSVGQFVFMLHSHLPYYRKAGMWPFGEENLYECMAETYIPLLNAIAELWEEGIKYIESHKEGRDVLISGGDPLTMETSEIEWLLSRLRAIKHVEFLRIGTKVPVVLPQRITPELTNMLKKYHPLWMSIHFTHPDEMTKETVHACEMLADAGIPLGSQTVLLKGINDNS